MGGGGGYTLGIQNVEEDRCGHVYRSMGGIFRVWIWSLILTNPGARRGSQWPYLDEMCSNTLENRFLKIWSIAAV